MALSYQNFYNDITNFLDKSQIIDGHSNQAQSFLLEQRNNFSSGCLFILLPQTTLQVSQIVKQCIKHSLSIIPQSGNSGLVGGSVSKDNSIIISSKLMDNIISIDPYNYSLTTQSGALLSQIKDFSGQYNLSFPLELPSASQCRIGGNIATNAGGSSTIYYGNIRNLVLGLEVILPNGEIFCDLNLLRKRNIGPSISDLFIGSEGILGFITAATLKLQAKNHLIIDMFLGYDHFSQLENSFQHIYAHMHSYITSFEIMNSYAVETTLSQFPNFHFPMPAPLAWQALVRFEFTNNDDISNSYANSLIDKYVIKNVYSSFCTKCNHLLWDLRYNIPTAQKSLKVSLKNDISLPLSRYANFLTNTLQDLQKHYKGMLYPIIFGHFGDGNLHFNISSKIDPDYIHSKKQHIRQIIIDNILKNHGTFSAEHGIGLINKQLMANVYPKQVHLLKKIKYIFDADNIFNPFKII